MTANRRVDLSRTELPARETAGVADYRLSLVFLAVLGAIALAVVVFGVNETGPGDKESDRVEQTL